MGIPVSLVSELMIPVDNKKKKKLRVPPEEKLLPNYSSFVLVSFFNLFPSSPSHSSPRFALLCFSYFSLFLFFPFLIFNFSSSSLLRFFAVAEGEGRAQTNEGPSILACSLAASGAGEDAKAPTRVSHRQGAPLAVAGGAVAGCPVPLLGISD